MSLAEQRSAPVIAEENLDTEELSTTSIDTDSSRDAESLGGSSSGIHSSDEHSTNDSLDGAYNQTDEDPIIYEHNHMKCFSDGLYFQTKLLRVKILDNVKACHFREFGE